MITKLNCGVSNFTNILHVADIHILLTKRHTEYTEVFKNLYKAIEKTPETTVVCVVGDVFHNKSDLSPECVEIASQFLKNLADRRPVILTAGNHDATLTNKNRLDSLSPIVNAIKHPNLFYLKDTGIYQLGDILFNNFSVFDEHSPENYIPFDKIPKVYVNNASYFIGLYHGPIDSAVTDIGYKVSSRTKNELFDGHQIILLGDIHRHQILQNYHITDDKVRKPVVVYSGSLIQQNHGEELKGHGFVYWDLKTLKFKHVEVKNDHGYFTVEVDKGTLVTDLTDIPKKTTLRIKSFESVATELKSVVSEIRKHTEIVDINYLRVDQLPSSVNNSVVPSLNIHGLSNISYQNKLIAEYLQDKHTNVPDSLIRDVEKINKELNDLIVKDLTAKNIRWKPKRFEFDNMFSYGEGNVIDFSKMKDVVGLFAANASGKSSILSALSFCIFDKCDRAFKAVHVMNTQKMSFKCKFNFEIDKVDYFIERIGHSDKKGSV
jgi:DNA repair exonuclease SbcCD nuclease subunit